MPNQNFHFSLLPYCLLGSHLLYELVCKNENVRAIYRRKKTLSRVKHVFSYFTDNAEALFNKIEWVEADITNLPQLETAFKDITHVYHCAAFVSFEPNKYKTLRKINIEGTANIVNLCIANSIKKLCYVSSVAAIGKSKTSLISDETTDWDESDDNSYYGKSKYLGELEVWRGIEEGLNAVVINPSVILGPADWNQSTMKLFKYVKDKNKFYTGGGNNFVDVRDVVNIMTSLMESNINAQKVIIANNRMEYKNLFTLIANALNVTAPSILINYNLLQILWRIEYLKAFIFNADPLLTKETAKVSLRKHEFSSEKIIKELNVSFTPIEKTISWIVNQL